VFDDGGDIVGTYTPVTKRLWQQRYKWVTTEQLAAAPPRDPTAQQQLVKPPKPCVVTYPFGSEPILREHYRQA
jgi:acyl-coenzyme A thioesterase 9